jgi:hypothetical protein
MVLLQVAFVLCLGPGLAHAALVLVSSMSLPWVWQ